MSKIIKNGLIYLLPSLVGSVLPLISLPLFTRFISIEDFGALALCQGFAIFINGISNFGLTIGFERDFFESKEVKYRASLLYSTLIFVFITYLTFAIATYALRYKITDVLIGNQKFSQLLIISYLAIGMTTIKSYFLTYYKNTENAKGFVFYTLDETLISFLISLILILYFRIGIIGIVISQFIASLIVVIILLFKFHKFLPFHLSGLVLKKSLFLSWPLTPRIFFGVIGSQFDKFIIGRINSVESVGLFSIAQRVSSIIFTLMTAIQNVWSPIVYKLMFNSKENSSKEIGYFLAPFFYFSTLIALIISLFSEEIVMIIFGKKNGVAAEMIIVLSILQCSYFFGKQNQLIFTKKTHLISILTLIGISLNIAINILFVHYWGAIGVAWGALLSGGLMGALSFYFSQKNFKIYWDFKTYFLVFTIYLLSSFFVIVMIHLNINGNVKLFVKSFLVASFIFSGNRFGILTIERMKNLFKIIMSRKSRVLL